MWEKVISPKNARIEMRNPMLKRANAPVKLTSVNRTNGFLLFLLALNDS
jgi:hypothetical protein